MREIILIGINHKTAPVELRECIAFSKDEAATATEALRGRPHIHESLLYSTCNRVELLLVTDDTPAAVADAKAFIADFNKIPVAQFESALYIHANDDAVRHLFRVAASLDSMIVGEPQILGQIKEAYRRAAEAKTAGVILNRLLHRAFFIAKRIRTETGIGDRAVSISYAAVELTRKIFGTLDGKRVLLIGAGEMAELAVEHLLRHPVAETFVANRTFENGLALARRFNGQAIRFEEIPEQLKRVDIIISSTGAPGFVITRDDVKRIIRARKNRPIFFIDIAVPRDIDPDINRLDNAYVYDIDDLKGTIEENIDGPPEGGHQGRAHHRRGHRPFPGMARQPRRGAHHRRPAQKAGDHRRGRDQADGARQRHVPGGCPGTLPHDGGLHQQDAARPHRVFEAGGHARRQGVVYRHGQKTV